MIKNNSFVRKRISTDISGFLLLKFMARGAGILLPKMNSHFDLKVNKVLETFY